MAVNADRPVNTVGASAKELKSSPRWMWFLPRVAAVLIPVAIAALLWFLHRTDLDEQRTTLINDTLWIEQYMRFQMDRNTEQLRLLGGDVFDNGVNQDAYTLRARTLIQQGESLVQILWLDVGGRVVHAVPPSVTLQRQRDAMKPELEEAFRFAARIGKPTYSGIYDIGQNDARFDVYVPHYRSGRLVGMTVGVYSAYTLFNRMVPWWFTERYRIALVDQPGTTLTSNSAVHAETEDVISYQLAFEPVGRGLALLVSAHRHGTRLVPGLIMATIVLLALAILVSLRATRRHMQHRFAAELALRNESAFRKAMEDSLITGMRARDLEGRIIYVNPAFCKMVGWDAQDLIGRGPPMPYWAPEAIEHTVAVHDRILAGSGPQDAVEVRFQRKNGERFDALIYEAPLIDADGRHAGWMGSVLDITARKQAEALYRQQQEKFQFTARLVTMGEMASTLAHELNQPLSAISSYTTGCLNLLRSNNGPVPDITGTLDKVVTQAQRAGQVIRRVHEFVRRREPQQDACQLNDIVEDAVGLMEAAAHQRATRVQLNLAVGLPTVPADKVMIEQLLLNLMRNGMDAMTETPTDQRVLTIATAVDVEGVCVTVTDRGCGIAPDVYAHLFEPFFSTKPDGMGMGLNICRSIAELHNGRLWFEPGPGNGTSFHVWLPEQR
jgi:two-component system, LuxR family, sensor histidine kinase DctS